MEKLSNTKTESKKGVVYKKMCVYLTLKVQSKV